MIAPLTRNRSLTLFYHVLSTIITTENERTKRYVQEDGSVPEEDLLDPSPAAILRRLGLGSAGALFIGGTEKVDERKSCGSEKADKDGIIQEVHSYDKKEEVFDPSKTIANEWYRILMKFI